MSPVVRARARLVRCFPRVSGDEPDIDSAAYDLERFSPRERG